MGDENGESTEEEVIGAGTGESGIEKLVWGRQRDTGTWFQRQGDWGISKAAMSDLLFLARMTLMASKG